MTPGDRIELRGLRVNGIVGVLPHEREAPQPLELDVDLLVDLRSAGASDQLTDTVDYGAVCQLVEDIVTGAAPLLLERLADDVARGVLALDERVEGAVVVVRKLRPPVPQELATSGVRVCRSRPAGGVE